MGEEVPSSTASARPSTKSEYDASEDRLPTVGPSMATKPVEDTIFVSGRKPAARKSASDLGAMLRGNLQDSGVMGEDKQFDRDTVGSSSRDDRRRDGIDDDISFEDTKIV